MEDVCSAVIQHLPRLGEFGHNFEFGGWGEHEQRVIDAIGEPVSLGARSRTLVAIKERRITGKGDTQRATIPGLLCPAQPRPQHYNYEQSEPCLIPSDFVVGGKPV